MLFRSGCGIYRKVKWIEVPTVHLEATEVVVQTDLTAESALVVVKMPHQTTQAVLKDKNHQVVAEGRCNEEGHIQLVLHRPNLWSAETPYLYDLELSLLKGQHIADQITMKVGLREVTFVPNEGLVINGKAVTLQGVCLHQDVGCVGIAAKKEVWKARLVSLKEMGCNAIRAAHHVHSSEFMDLCDEMGFYVYEECFDKWTGGLYGRYFETDWQEDVAAMVKRDRNRPSVIIWGVGNEVEHQGQDSMLERLKMLYTYAKSLDATRPVTYAMNPHFKRASDVDLSTIKDIQAFVDEVSDTEIEALEEREIGRAHV